MYKFILIFAIAILWQGCCTPYCSMESFAANSRVLFGEQIEDGLHNTPGNLRLVGSMLKGNVSSFQKTGSYVFQVGKGDFASMKTTARVVREQWNESIENIPKNAKAIGLYTCLYCDKKK